LLIMILPYRMGEEDTVHKTGGLVFGVSRTDFVEIETILNIGKVMTMKRFIGLPKS